MNTLDYCISLRENGLESTEIKKKLKELGFKEPEIQYYLKKSDDIFLNKLIHNTGPKPKEKQNNTIKMIALALSLILLLGAFLGYIRIGLVGLSFIWSIVGYSSYRK